MFYAYMATVCGVHVLTAGTGSDLHTAHFPWLLVPGRVSLGLTALCAAKITW